MSVKTAWYSYNVSVCLSPKLQLLISYIFVLSAMTGQWPLMSFIIYCLSSLAVTAFLVLARILDIILSAKSFFTESLWWIRSQLTTPSTPFMMSLFDGENEVLSIALYPSNCLESLPRPLDLGRSLFQITIIMLYSLWTLRTLFSSSF